MNAGNMTTRIAFLVNNFRQGQGGVPEAVRLMAKATLEYGYISDVVAGDRVFENVGSLPQLPRSHDDTVRRNTDYSAYDFIVIVGPWQSPFRIANALFRNRNSGHFIYIPKGGLAKIEFSRIRDLKKIPYLCLIEILWLVMARQIVVSSRLELESLPFPVSLFRSKCRIIPDFFCPSWPRVKHASPPASDDKLRFFFMAEIHPRKGLEEAIYGFHDWVVKNNLTDSVLLTVGGEPRPGSQDYYNRVKQFVECTPLRDCVKFVGAVAHEDRLRFYADSDVFLATSRFESFCLTVLEALHSECLVLAGPDLGVLEYVRQSQNLFVISDLSRSAIMEGLGEIFRKINARKAVVEPSGHEEGSLDVSRLVNSMAIQRWRELLG